MKDAALTCNAADASASGWGWAFTFMHATKIADGTDPNGDQKFGPRGGPKFLGVIIMAVSNTVCWVV